MTIRGRIAIAHGAMLADPDLLGNSLGEAGAALFDPQFWRQRGELEPTPGGRGGSFFIGNPAQAWVLRHYRRGGWAARISVDRYVWCGESQVRAFAEWRLLSAMRVQGLPVPPAVAAGYQRRGLTYRCDLITVRMPGTLPLTVRLRAAPLPAAWWMRIGATVRRFHEAGVDHADLNAHNILCTAQGDISLIDFDRGRQRAAGAWRQVNLARLQRSLCKVTAGETTRFGAAQWQQLLQGYRAGA